MQKSNLTDLFDEETQKELEGFGKVLLIDFHNLVYKNVFTAVHFNPEDNEEFFVWRHLMFNNIMTTIQKFQPEKVILAVDTKGSWRYDFFDGYKSKRKGTRDGAAVDFEKFFPILSEFIIDLQKTFSTIYTIRLPRTEGDDIIATLINKKFKSNTEVVIVSSDRDMNQLMTNPNVKQYDPVAGKFLESINPRKELAIKILSGDRSDSIPPIKRLVGPVRAEKILKEGFRTWLDSVEDEIERGQIESNFIRNKKLIDLSEIPEDIENEIINTYDTYQISPIDGSKLMSFFGKNRLIKHMEEWQNCSEFIKALI